MDELKRNGSGYYDPTAFKALKKIERAEKEMEVKKGEIWEVEFGNNLRTVLVIAAHGSYSTILTFCDEPRERRTVQLNAQGMKYTEPGMLTYKFNDGFNRFIRLATEEEFADIIGQVECALGIDLNAPIPLEVYESKEIKRLQMEVEDLKAKNLKLEKGNTHFASMATDTNTTILKTERDLYKSQYESLLERVIAKAV